MTAPATTVSRTNRPTATAALTLPSMPDTSPALQATLRQVLERLAVLDGQRGDDLDAAVTRRELVDAGIAGIGRRSSGDNGLVPVFDSNEWTNIPYLTAMPTPKAPEVRTMLGANYLMWELPNARGVGSTEIFRTVDGVGTTVGTVVGSQFVDWVQPDVTYVYKIRFIGETGGAGDWSAEVVVNSAVDPSHILSVLNDTINESALVQELRERITTGGSIDQSIAAETLARTQAITAEAQARGTAITSEATLRIEGDSQLAQNIDTLTAVVDGNIAAIQTEQTARADADSALSTRIDTLTTTVDGNTAAIVSEATTRAAEDVALSEVLDSLTAKMDDTYALMAEQIRVNATGDAATVNDLSLALARIAASESAITSEQNIRTTADNALGERIETLTSTVSGNQASLVQNYYTKTAADSAITEATTTALSKVVTTDADGNVADLSAAVKSKVTTEANAVTGQAIAKLTYQAQSGNKVAGFGLSNDGTVSEFAINADKFYLLQGAATPFSVVNGVAYFNTAMIKDASISTAKIANLDATVATIAKASIYDAAIGGQIYSSNYNNTTKTGWSLNQDGSAFFGGNTTFAGRLDIGKAGSGNGVVINNNGIYVYDSDGRVRVAIGKLP